MVDGKIQVARFNSIGFDPFNNWFGWPIEIGAKGKLVKIHGVHYLSGYLETLESGTHHWATALSSNPEHAGDLALGLDDFYGSPALYASHHWNYRVMTSDAGRAMMWDKTAIIPLYGLIRPSRQVWINYKIVRDPVDRWAVEIYYEDVEIGRVDQDAYNRKYGKYRRS